VKQSVIIITKNSSFVAVKKRMDSSEKSPSSSTHSNYIDQPNPDDVLLGRNASIFHHPGNRRYRHIVALNLKRYKESKTRLDKMVLIREVTEQILDNGRVKFLRPSSGQSEQNQPQKWVEVPIRTAQDKVSHALRDGINKPIFAPLMGDNTTTPTVDAESQSSRNNKEGDDDDSYQSDNQDKEEDDESNLNSDKQKMSLEPNLQNLSSKSEILNNQLFSSSESSQNSFNLGIATTTTRNPNNMMELGSRELIHQPPIYNSLERISAATAATRAALARLSHDSPLLPPPTRQTPFPLSVMNVWNLEQKLRQQQQQQQQQQQHLLRQRQLIQLQLQQQQLQRQNLIAMATAPSSLLNLPSSTRRIPGTFGPSSSPLLAGLSSSILPNVRAPLLEEPGRILPMTRRPQLYSNNNDELLRSSLAIDTLLSGRPPASSAEQSTATAAVNDTNVNLQPNTTVISQTDAIALAQRLYSQQKQQQQQQQRRKLTKGSNRPDRGGDIVEKGGSNLDTSSSGETEQHESLDKAPRTKDSPRKGSPEKR
jgi:hypothetical protein